MISSALPNYPLIDGKVTIFLFHGVIKTHRHRVRNYIRKHIDEARFRQLLQGWKSEGTPLSMDQLVETYQKKATLPKKSFVITFDDGFENNYSVAAPILREFKIPSIFYLTSNWVDKNRMAWVDRIEYCLELVPEGTVHLPWEAQPRKFSRDEEKIALLEALRTKIKSDASVPVEEVVKGIFEQCNIPPIEASSDPLDLKMSWDQVKELSKDPLFKIGGHTHNHAIMSFLTPERLGEEIDTNLKLLTAQVGYKISHFAYPDGQAHHYNAQVIEALKKRNIVCCPTAISGVNDLNEDLFHLRRFFAA